VARKLLCVEEFVFARSESEQPHGAAQLRSALHG
jgi:hypothetical protein